MVQRSNHLARCLRLLLLPQGVQEGTKFATVINIAAGVVLLRLLKVGGPCSGLLQLLILGSGLLLASGRHQALDVVLNVVEVVCESGLLI